MAGARRLNIGAFADAGTAVSPADNGRVVGMVELSGIEPLTSSLRTTRSPN